MLCSPVLIFNSIVVKAELTSAVPSSVKITPMTLPSSNQPVRSVSRTICETDSAICPRTILSFLDFGRTSLSISISTRCLRDRSERFRSRHSIWRNCFSGNKWPVSFSNATCCKGRFLPFDDDADAFCAVWVTKDPRSCKTIGDWEKASLNNFETLWLKCQPHSSWLGIFSFRARRDRRAHRSHGRGINLHRNRSLQQGNRQYQLVISLELNQQSLQPAQRSGFNSDLVAKF